MLPQILEGDEGLRMGRGGRCESVGMGDNSCNISRRRGVSLARSTDEKEVRGFSHGLGGQPMRSRGVLGSDEASGERSQEHRFDSDTLACRRFPCT